LLWQTDQTVGEIADTLGFSDSFHLSKSFKRLTGLTPTEFRRRRLRHIP
jgi:AraC-like DNA-binding protein